MTTDYLLTGLIKSPLIKSRKRDSRELMRTDWRNQECLALRREGRGRDMTVLFKYLGKTKILFHGTGCKIMDLSSKKTYSN